MDRNEEGKKEEGGLARDRNERGKGREGRG